MFHHARFEAWKFKKIFTIWLSIVIYDNIVVMRYIGCKKLLLKDIEKVIDENIDNAKSFCDIFSGTTIVAQYFKPKYKIISNDLMNFSYCIQKAVIENNFNPKFENLFGKSIQNPIDFFNNLPISQMEKLPKCKRFCQNNYSPRGGRMYVTDENALRIDYIRNEIENWRKENLIANSEYYYLLASLIEAVPYISNISGTYGAFNKWWDKRALKPLRLKDFDIKNNNHNNLVFNKEGIQLLLDLSGDILYIDPPYNNRQYPPNYHVLETVAMYDFPELKGVTGQRDYTNKKSLFCNKAKARIVFEELIKKAQFKHIILSYSTEGIISTEEIITILKKYGIPKSLKIYEIPYRRFKSNQMKSKVALKEFLFYVEKNI